MPSEKHQGNYAQGEKDTVSPGKELPMLHYYWGKPSQRAG